jgi:hypothetical protein
MKLVLSLISILFATALYAESGSPDVWERCAFGAKQGCEYVNLQGYNGAITTTGEPLWPESAAYTVLAVAMSSPYCASTSNDDDGDPTSNTGAWTIRVRGITSAFAAFSETKTLNGQTSVALTNTTAMFINSVEVLTAGSGGVNAGVIACGTGTNTAGDPAVIHAYVAVGQNRSVSSMYGVPASYTMLCRNWSLQSYGVTAAQTVQFLINRYVNAGILKQEYLGFLNQAGVSTVVIPDVVKFAEKTIFKVEALSAASTGPAAVRAECILLSNEEAGRGLNAF